MVQRSKDAGARASLGRSHIARRVSGSHPSVGAPVCPWHSGDMNVRIKRVYEKAEAADGFRVLVDRIWPRGVSKHDAAVDEWLKEIGPSSELRKWYGHTQEKFDEFRTRYRAELDENDAVQRLRDRIAEHPDVTLVFSARDPETSQAAVLRDYLTASAD